jgi:rubrerythrin
VLPLIWIIRRLRQRPKVGCCTACGYNLTGNTSGVCPECGTPSTAGVKA